MTADRILVLLLMLTFIAGPGGLVLRYRSGRRPARVNGLHHYPPGGSVKLLLTAMFRLLVAGFLAGVIAGAALLVAYLAS
jgi:hypothetical protein